MDRHDEVDCAHDGRDAEDVEAENPHVLAESHRVGLLGERDVAGPTRCGGSGLGQESAVHHETAEWDQPEGERVDPGEGHVARPDHQRNEIVAEAGEDRNDPEEDHGGPVERHDLVVELCREEVVVADGQLGTHQQRHDAANQEEEKGRVEVHDADLLMVDGGEPLDDPVAPRGSLAR
jgi:hypothetical protein